MKKKMDVVELTQKLVAMETINPPGNELKCAAFLAEVLESGGFDTELLTFADGRANLIARMGHVDGVRPICLTGHLDTVPLGDQPWTRDPFKGEIINGKVFGRGTCDMKGGVAAITIAALNIGANLKNTGGVTLVFTCGEETGCEGAKALCKIPEMLGEAGSIIVGEPTSNKPLVGHKGAFWLRAVCKGATAHGSTPELGVNAIYEACRAVGKIEEFDFEIPDHEIMGSPSINVGRMRGGININSVPDHAEFDIDIRSIPSQNHSDIRNNLFNLFEKRVRFESTINVGSVFSEVSDPWIEEVFECVEEVQGYKAEIETANYFTDASVLSPAYGNPPTIILGPGDAFMAHKTDEYCEIKKLKQAVNIYEKIIRRRYKII